MRSGLILRAMAALAAATSILLGACPAGATKIKMHLSGVTLSVAEELTSTDPLVFTITAGTGLEVPHAYLLFKVTNLGDKSRDTTTIWAGSTQPGTVFELTHAVGDLPVGRYQVAVSFRFPQTPARTGGGSSDGYFLEITEEGWSISKDGFRTQEIRKIMAELKALGIDSLSSPKLHEVAPDLESRLNELGVGPMPKNIHPYNPPAPLPPSPAGERVYKNRGEARSPYMTAEDSARSILQFRELEAAARQRLRDSLAAGDTVIVDRSMPPKIRRVRVRPRPNFDGPQGRILTAEEGAKRNEGRRRTLERMRRADSLKMDSLAWEIAVRDLD